MGTRGSDGSAATNLADRRKLVARGGVATRIPVRHRAACVWGIGSAFAPGILGRKTLDKFGVYTDVP